MTEFDRGLGLATAHSAPGRELHRHQLSVALLFVAGFCVPLDSIRLQGLAVGSIAMGVAAFHFALSRMMLHGTLGTVGLRHLRLPLAILLLPLFSSLVHLGPEGTVALFGYALMAASGAVLAVLAGDSQRNRTALLFGLILGSDLSITYALVSGQANDRLLGLSFHPNSLGFYAALAACGALVETPRLQKGVRLFLILSTIANTMGVVLSGSRSAVLALAAGILAWLWVTRRLIRFGSIAVLPIGYLLVFRSSIESTSGGLGRIAASGELSASNDGREELLADAWRQLSLHPLLGVGPGTGLFPHNIVLQVGLLGGVLAAALTMLLLIRTTYSCLKLLQARSMEGLSIAEVAIVTLVTTALQPFLFEPIVFYTLLLPLVALSGLDRGRTVKQLASWRDPSPPVISGTNRSERELTCVRAN